MQQAKSFLRDQLGLPPAAVLVAAGLAAHLALNAALRRPPTSAWGLLAPLILGAGLETYEIWVQYRSLGLLAPGNDPLWMILGRHGLDVLKLLAAPLLLVAFGAFSLR